MRRVFVLLALVPLVALAEGPFNEDFETKPWQEEQVTLPPYPKQSDLIPFVASAATSFKFFIDGPSISIGKDRVVRFTLYARSDEGAVTVSYEGIRCETREMKDYAFGEEDGTWTAVRDPRWVRIHSYDVNRPEASLYSDFFCPYASPIRSRREAIAALKRAASGFGSAGGSDAGS